MSEDDEIMGSEDAPRLPPPPPPPPPSLPAPCSPLPVPPPSPVARPQLQSQSRPVPPSGKFPVPSPASGPARPAPPVPDSELGDWAGETFLDELPDEIISPEEEEKPPSEASRPRPYSPPPSPPGGDQEVDEMLGDPGTVRPAVGLPPSASRPAVPPPIRYPAPPVPSPENDDEIDEMMGDPVSVPSAITPPGPASRRPGSGSGQGPRIPPVQPGPQGQPGQTRAARKQGFKRFPPNGQGGRPLGTHAQPLVVEGGIKIQGEGRIGQTWWASRWIHVLESFGWTNRMERGRNYARQGQVIDVSIRPGLVTGHVQGARAEPYRVSIRLHVLPDHQWSRVIGLMSRAAMYTAKLLAGEMPDGIERIFGKARSPLFPTQPRHLKTSCTCPDPINPCKHIAALYYILAEEFDRDPFMLFKLRGKDKEAFMAELRSSWGQKEKPAGDLEEDEMAPLEPEEREEADFLEEEIPLAEIPPEQFWKIGPALSDFKAGLIDPPVFQAILKRLGPPPVWKGSQDDFLREMAPIYVEVRKRALAIAWGERKT